MLDDRNDFIKSPEHELWMKSYEVVRYAELALGSKMSYTIQNMLSGLLFILARYKFASKMIQNKEDIVVIDLGCNEGLGTLLLKQMCKCKKIIGVDFDQSAIEWASQNLSDEVLEFLYADFMGRIIYPEKADALVSLDVIEHIPVEKEDLYVDTIANNLKKDGCAVIGTPNVAMYKYANEINKKAHINNYDQKRLYSLLSKRFHNVFIFGMNDEVLHTGFYPMSCYIVALCCNKK